MSRSFLLSRYLFIHDTPSFIGSTAEHITCFNNVFLEMKVLSFDRLGDFCAGGKRESIAYLIEDKDNLHKPQAGYHLELGKSVYVVTT